MANAPLILTNVAILFVIAVLWTRRQGGEQASPATRTWLIVAALFAVISALVTLLNS